MKKIILLSLILIGYLYPQAGNTIPRRVDTLETTVDSLGANYVTKSTAQTITAQKNFMGTVKFNSDTSMQIGTIDAGNNRPTFLDWARLGNVGVGDYYSFGNLFTTSVPGKDSISDWTMEYQTWNFLDIVGHGMYWGLNQNRRRTTEPVFSFVSEAPYRAGDTTEIYEWYWFWGDQGVGGSYGYRPFGLAVYYYRDSVTNAPLSSIPKVELAEAFDNIIYMDKDRNPIIEMRLDGSGSSVIDLIDSVAVKHYRNNYPWLYQYKFANDGTYKEMMRVDTNDDVVINPNGDDNIKLGSPLTGTIQWNNYAGTANITALARDNVDRTTVGDVNGIYTQKISVGYVPTDTTGLNSGQIVADPNSGNLRYLIPLNILVNGDFTDWTLDNPDDWSSTAEDAGNYVTENPTGKLNIVTDGTVNAWTIYQNSVCDSAVEYGYSINVVSVSSNDTLVVSTTSGGNVAVTAAGIYTGTFTATGLYYDQIALRNINNNALDCVIDDFKIWVKDGSAKQTTYEVKNSPLNVFNPSVDDTLFLGRKEVGAIYDSIRVFDIQDSIAIQVFYRNPTDNNLITTVDTLATDTTINFDVDTIPAGAKVYMYFVFIGDSEAYLRSQIYWRE